MHFNFCYYVITYISFLDLSTAKFGTKALLAGAEAVDLVVAVDVAAVGFVGSVFTGWVVLFIKKRIH